MPTLRELVQGARERFTAAAAAAAAVHGGEAGSRVVVRGDYYGGAHGAALLGMLTVTPHASTQLLASSSVGRTDLTLSDASASLMVIVQGARVP
jgi:hypothetical protein